MLKLKVILAVKTHLSTQPVSFISKSKDASRVMRYSEYKKSKKRLKASQLMCLKLHQLRQPSLSRHFRKILELVWFILEVQS